MVWQSGKSRVYETNTDLIRNKSKTLLYAARLTLFIPFGTFYHCEREKLNNKTANRSLTTHIDCSLFFALLFFGVSSQKEGEKKKLLKRRFIHGVMMLSETLVIACNWNNISQWWCFVTKWLAVCMCGLRMLSTNSQNFAINWHNVAMKWPLSCKRLPHFGFHCFQFPVYIRSSCSRKRVRIKQFFF